MLFLKFGLFAGNLALLWILCPLPLLFKKNDEIMAGMNELIFENGKIKIRIGQLLKLSVTGI